MQKLIPFFLFSAIDSSYPRRYTKTSFNFFFFFPNPCHPLRLKVQASEVLKNHAMHINPFFELLETYSLH